MKKIIRDPFVIIICTIILSIMFSILLYKLFCKLDQTIDWDAVNGIAGIVMIFTTGGAIYVAIYIPKEDMINRSKIDLFDKRFETYYQILDYFKGYYLGKESKKEFEYINRLFVRTRFLISSSDLKAINGVVESIKQKMKDIEIDKRHLYDIMEELSKIEKIFDKYLDVRNYSLRDE